MIKKIFNVITISTLFLVSINSQANSLNLAWQTTGFQQPESIVKAVNNEGYYVSNINGQPSAVDGNGYISLVANDGTIKTLKWLEGMNAPKGMAVHGNTLYVSDINELLVIDIPTASISHRYSTHDKSFLNDVAVNSDGMVYVSDTANNRIYSLKGKQFEIWLDDVRLENPNGLYIDNEYLMVSSWGQQIDNNWNTDIPGHILLVSQKNKQIQDFVNNTPIGNLDGLIKLTKQQFLVTDWMNGKLIKVSTNGQTKTIMELGQGSADMLYDNNKKLLLIPQMLKNSLLAYTIK